LDPTGLFYARNPRSLFSVAESQRGAKLEALKQSLDPISKPDANVFYFWGPNNEAIEKAIASGKLKGTIKKDKDGAHCTLNADPENYKALASPDYWEWTKPEAFFKNGRDKAKK